jgi:hypothetical protein
LLSLFSSLMRNYSRSRPLFRMILCQVTFLFRRRMRARVIYGCSLFQLLEYCEVVLFDGKNSHRIIDLLHYNCICLKPCDFSGLWLWQQRLLRRLSITPSM